MLKGLAITPPVLGRISIGKVIEKMVSDCQRKMINSPSPRRFKARMAGYYSPSMTSCARARTTSCAASRYACCSTNRS